MWENETILICLLFVHWIADFVFQSRWMGENKSTLTSALFIHIGVYTWTTWILLLLPVEIIYKNPTGLFKYVMINSLSHLFIDFFTSKSTKHFYLKKEMHKFWCIIGFDQLLHIGIIVFTAHLLTG